MKRSDGITDRRKLRQIEAQLREEMPFYPGKDEKILPSDLFNNMPIPTDLKIKVANAFFSDKTVPVATLATVGDIRKFSSKLPQVCFMGRSNVGKSSLLNTLVGIPRLATVSATPGCTKTINLYSLNQRMLLADLPGFGFANVARRQYDGWIDLVKTYLKKMVIHRAFLLIDCRRGIMDIDKEVMGLLAQHSIVHQIVLTKIDELTARQIEDLRLQIHNQLAAQPLLFPEVLVSSAHFHHGIDMLRVHCLETCGLIKDINKKV